MKHYNKIALALLMIAAIAASTAGVARADNDKEESEHDRGNGRFKVEERINEQAKKAMEMGRELLKKTAEAAATPWAPIEAQPDSLMINPNGEMRLTGADVVTAPGAASSTSLTARVWGVTFTLTLDNGSQLSARGGAISASQIQVGDTVTVTGTMNAASPLTVQVRQLKDHTLNAGVGSSDEVTRLRAQIQALMDKLSALLARTGGSTATSTTTSTPVAVIPTLASISPASSTAGAANLTLSVAGTNFTTSSVIYWASTALATMFNSTTQLSAIVPAANLVATGTTPITVTNPGTLGGTSNAVTFTVNSASTSTATSTQ